ncbi:hypothetical protein CLOM_g24023 [Closterium sp. NIES-68]|nr:hypothetical protein CLOM_g24023 [Closterium sp. NIES-68]GJP80968.1 hypothetical protein CLOP_g11159 [Closterium sp. NIES-67]
MAQSNLSKDEATLFASEGGQEDTGIGTGPEYDYPKTAKKDPETAIVDAPGPEEGKGGEDAPGENEPELTEKEIEEEESLEQEGAGEWSEDMAQNVPQPGDAPTGIPEDTERLPSDRG